MKTCDAISLAASCVLSANLLHSHLMQLTSQEKIDLVKRTSKEEYDEIIDDERAEDFIRRSQQLLEWFTEVTSQDGFQWPEDFDPQAYGLEEV